MAVIFRKKYIKITVVLVVLFVLMAGLKVAADDYSSLQKFQEILYLINNYYVQEVKIPDLIDGAINGMINKLDPFSSYLSPEEYEEMQLEFDGHFQGIGIVITTRNDQLTIVSPIKGTPGDKAGLQAGDIITKIDGKATEKMSQEKAVNLMRGEEGTGVELTIQREDSEDPINVSITRADIEIPYVESRMETDDIGYVALYQFVDNVGVKVAKAIKDLQDQGAKGIIFDLRSNPGGILQEAVNVASNFIDEGKIVSIKQRTGEEQVLEVNKDIKSIDLPLVVLINGGSASASEIVSGAIKDYERGKLVGSKTFGKGTVQSVIPLEDGSALRVTTARYYTPAGNFIHEKGIKPDIEIKYDKDNKEDNQLQKAVEVLKSMMK